MIKNFFTFHFLIFKCNAYLLLAIFFLLIFSSCSNTKYLPVGETLYTGAEVKMESAKKISGKKSFQKKLVAITRPKPNATIFGLLRARLWFYNIAGKPTGKGLRYFIKNKMGEPPVLLSKADPETDIKIIDAKLFNSGFFSSTVSYNVKEKNKRAKIIYTINTHPPYTISAINFPSGEDVLTKTISDSKKETFLKTKDNYDLDVIKKEHIRIDEKIKENGFFYFNPDYLVFDVDSSREDGKVILNLKVKENIPEKALRRYKINDVYVVGDYSLGKDSVTKNKDTTLVNTTYFISGNNNFKPKAIIRSVFLKKENIYNRHDQNMTLSRLMGLGTFKFATVKFSDLDSVKPGYFDAHVLLTPLQKRSIRLELQGISKSNDYVGPAFSMSYRNRNTLRASELLIFNIKTSYEFQYGKNISGLNSFEIGPSVELYVPRFLTPFKVTSPTSYFIPKTKFSVGYDYLIRAQYFNLYSLKFTYGYKWKETLLKDHELNPVVINFISLTKKTPAFDALLNTNPLLKKSFEEQFITGATYSFTYNEQLLPEKRNQFYFNGNADVSGNLAYLFSKAINKRSPEDTRPYEIAGSVFSQYAKGEVDGRYYFIIDEKNKLAFRLYGGYGKAYGNSTTLPYFKQFFSGGASSIRAFSARSVGPGSYFTPDSIRTTAFFEQGGDIKLEANAEYRFNIINIVKGALFADAGNIWLDKDNPEIPGGKFSSKFLSETAVGTGFGIRVDPGFFVIRLDLAFPLRKPFLPEGERWVIKQIRFGSSSWRGDNLVLNIAIGYPF
jgi:outer membrane protein insertion porin family